MIVQLSQYGACNGCAHNINMTLQLQWDGKPRPRVRCAVVQNGEVVVKPVHMLPLDGVCRRIQHHTRHKHQCSSFYENSVELAGAVA